MQGPAGPHQGSGREGYFCSICRWQEASSPPSPEHCLPRGSSTGKGIAWPSLKEKPLAKRAGGVPCVPLLLSNQLFN